MAVKPAPLAKESVGLFKRGQKALLDRLQKMVDDGASKADLDKVAGNASKIKPGPGAIKRLKDTEARFIDWVTRQKRFTKGGAYKSGGKGVDGKKTGAIPQAAKDIRVKRGVARTIVYGGGATALGTAGNATSNSNNTSSGDAAVSATNPKGITPAEKARIMREAAKKEKEIRAGGIRSQDKANSKGKLFKKFRPFGGVLARALLGDDEKFGGERGAIDFIRLKKKKNKTPTEKEKMEVMMREAKKLKAAEKKAAEDVAKAKQKAKGLKNGGMAKKPVKKNMGGMMKKKGYSKGGAMKKKGYSKGGVAKKKKGYAMGGQASKFPDLNKDGKVTQADILKGRGVAKKNMGGSMKKKGYANGGMAKKGYANGGPAKKTTAKKTASRGKARGVGAATRGYGRAMKK